MSSHNLESAEELPESVRQRFEKQTSTLEFHKQHPEVSYEIYSLAKRLELGAKVLKLRRIYLDQKYWIYCRDAHRGKPQKPIHTNIWLKLSAAVRCGKAICPAHETVFAETLKQVEDSQRATAEVVDILSGKVALQPFLARFRKELSHLAWEQFLGEKRLKPLRQRVWLPLGFLMEEIIPSGTPFSKDLEVAVQKSIYDVSANVGMLDIIETLKGIATPLERDDAKHVALQNHLATAHRAEFKSFDDVYRIEVEGALDGLSDEISKFARFLFEQGKFVEFDGKPPRTSDAQAWNILQRLVTQLTSHEITTELPFVHVGCGIHAAIRHKRQNYHVGDNYDHQHACAALAYCDAFFTERSLGNLLVQKPLEYDKIYNCRVIWEDEAALAYVESL
jgi:hypothetical protein